MESKTPRTDAELKLEAFMDGFGIVEVVQIDFARQLETELANKERQLAEAYDYATSLLLHIVKNQYQPIEGFGPFPKPDVLGVLTQIDNAYTGVRNQLADAKAEIERLKREHVELLIKYDEKFDVIDTKDKLIEQLREALKGASKHFDRNYWNVKNDPDFEDLNKIWSNIEAALAAERGE